MSAHKQGNAELFQILTQSTRQDHSKSVKKTRSINFINFIYEQAFAYFTVDRFLLFSAHACT